MWGVGLVCFVIDWFVMKFFDLFFWGSGRERVRMVRGILFGFKCMIL